MEGSLPTRLAVPRRRPCESTIPLNARLVGFSLHDRLPIIQCWSLIKLVGHLMLNFRRRRAYHQERNVYDTVCLPIY